VRCTTFIALLIVLGTFALPAAAQTRVAALAPAKSVAQPPPVPAGVYLGVFCNTFGRGATKDQKEACTESLEREWGRPAAVQLSYFTYANLDESTLLSDPAIIGDLKFHRIPLISQGCQTSLKEYRPGGAAQASVDSAMKAMKAYPGPVIYTWFHEFDSCIRMYSESCKHNGDSAACFSEGASDEEKQADYKAAWHFVFSERNRLGATNVALGWRPTSRITLAGYYPGDAEVDWILPDVYDRKGRGFVAAIRRTYNAYCTPNFTSKPCGLAEFGETGCSGSRAGVSQEQFLQSIETSIKSTFPNIHLLAWFDAQTNPQFNWLLDDCGGHRAMAALANSQAFKASP
jgi:hypothetical protein